MVDEELKGPKLIKKSHISATNHQNGQYKISTIRHHSNSYKKFSARNNLIFRQSTKKYLTLKIGEYKPQNCIS